MAWTKIWSELGNGKQDQTTLTYNPKRREATCTVMQTWCGETDDKTTESITLIGATDGTNTVPTVGGVYTIAGVTYYVCTQAIPKRTGPLTFEAQITFAWTYTPTPGTDKYNVSLSFSGQKFTQDAYQDKDGNPVENSAGQSFSPTVKETFYDEIIDVSYNVASDQSATFNDLRGKVNSGSVSFTIRASSRTFDTRCLLLDSASQTDTANPLSDGTITYAVKLRFINRSDSLEDMILDQGYYSLDGSGKLVAITDKYQKPVSAPVKLDGSGGVLSSDADPVFLTFKIEGEADLSSAFTGLA